MGELYITLNPDTEHEYTLPFMQAIRLGELMDKHKDDSTRYWHFNQCDHPHPCISLHTANCAYVIDTEGVEDVFEGPGCDCRPEEETYENT